jgi:hypothetical protein
MTSKSGRGGRRYLPCAFTEQGVAMLSSVLHSDRVVQVNIEIMRAFVRLRRLLATHADLASKLEELEKRFAAQFQVVFEAIRQLMAPPAAKPKGRIGFHTPGKKADQEREKQERDGPKKRPAQRPYANGRNHR